MKHTSINLQASVRIFMLLSIFISGCSTTFPDETAISDNQGNAIITFASYEEDRDFYQPLLQEFHLKNPGITVQFVNLPETANGLTGNSDNNYWRQVASTADTFFIPSNINIDKSTPFLNLEPLMEADDTFPLQDYWDNVLTACQDPNGGLRGLPTAISIYGIYYNQAWFDEVGLPYPLPGWTWDDFRQTMDSIVSDHRTHGKVVFVDQASLQYSLAAPMIMTYINKATGDVNAEALWKDKRWYFDMSAEGSILPIRSVENWEAENGRLNEIFQNEGPAMWVGHITEQARGGSATIQSAAESFDGWSINQYGFVPFPIAAENPDFPTNPAISNCLAISAGTQNPSSAWKWLKFLSEKWLQPDRAQPEGIASAPARKSVAEAGGYFDLVPPKVRASVQFALDHALFSGSYTREIELLEPALLRVLAGETDFALEFQSIQNTLLLQSENIASTPVTVVTPPKPPSANTTVVKFIAQFPNDPDQENGIQNLIDEYNLAQSEVTVQFSSQSEGGLEWIAQHSDCFYSYEPFWEMNSPDDFLDLTSLVEMEPASFVADFFPGLLDAYRLEGRLYGLPAVSKPYVIAYNLDLITKRGLQPPQDNWNFNEFMELAQAATSNAPGDVSYGFEYTSWDHLFYAGQGVRWIDLFSVPPAVYFDTPEMAAYLAWLKDMTESGVLSQFGDGSTEEIAALQNGQIAFWVAMAGEDGLSLPPGQETPYDIGFAPVPAVALESELIRGSQSQGLFISPTTRNPAACWDWIKFLSDHADILGGIPARQSVAGSENWIAKVGEQNAAVYRAALEQITPFDQQPTYPPIVGPLFSWRGEVVTRVLAGEPVSQILKAIQTQAGTYLACMTPIDGMALNRDELYAEIDRCTRQADSEKE